MKKNAKNTKTFLTFLLGSFAGIFLILSTLFLIVYYVVFEFPLPWKITDPSSPNFRAESIKLTDYKSKRDLDNVLETVLPVGTRKKRVEKVLLKNGVVVIDRRNVVIDGAQQTNIKYSYRNLRSALYEYLYMTPTGDFNWTVSIYFNENNKLVKIRTISP